MPFSEDLRHVPGILCEHTPFPYAITCHHQRRYRMMLIMLIVAPCTEDPRGTSSAVEAEHSRRYSIVHLSRPAYLRPTMGNISHSLQLCRCIDAGLWPSIGWGPFFDPEDPFWDALTRSFNRGNIYTDSARPSEINAEMGLSRGQVLSSRPPRRVAVYSTVLRLGQASSISLRGRQL